MGYDKSLLESWAKMSDWGDYLDRNGGINKLSSKEGFDFLSRKYYRMVKERIDYCKKLVKEHPADTFLCYVMAELFDRCNEDESPAYLYKRHVRHYALKALEIDPDFAPAKALLKKVDAWIEFIGGDQSQMPRLEISFEKQKKELF